MPSPTTPADSGFPPDIRERLRQLDAERDGIAASHGANGNKPGKDSAENADIIGTKTKPIAPAPALPRTLDEVVTAFQRWLHMPDAAALLVTLASVHANFQPGDPVWLMLVGPPGFGKTELLNALANVPHTRSASVITEGALLSGVARRDRTKDATGGLLRSIGAFGILVCKDFTSIISMNREQRAATLAALRECYDGSWTRHIGTDGGRTLHWAGKLGFLAGCTDAIDSAHAVMGSLGERFAFFRLPDGDDSQRALVALAHSGLEPEMRSELADLVEGLFVAVSDVKPDPITDEQRDWLISLARLAVRCRSHVERDPIRREITLVPGAEAPTRLVMMLSRLLQSLLTIGVDEPQARQLVARVGLDSMPKIRRIALRQLAVKDEQSTHDIAISVGYPYPTMKQALEDLEAHGILHRRRVGGNQGDKWTFEDWAGTAYGLASGYGMSATEASGYGTAESVYDVQEEMGEGDGDVVPLTHTLLQNVSANESTRHSVSANSIGACDCGADATRYGPNGEPLCPVCYILKAEGRI